MAQAHLELTAVLPHQRLQPGTTDVQQTIWLRAEPLSFPSPQQTPARTSLEMGGSCSGASGPAGRPCTVLEEAVHPSATRKQKEERGRGWDPGTLFESLMSMAQDIGSPFLRLLPSSSLEPSLYRSLGGIPEPRRASTCGDIAQCQRSDHTGRHCGFQAPLQMHPTDGTGSENACYMNDSTSPVISFFVSAQRIKIHLRVINS